MEMLYVLDAAGKKIINSQNLMAFRQQVVTKVGTDKSGTPCY